MPVSGPVPCAKSSQMHTEIHKEDSSDSGAPFQASKGWLWRFCHRHGVRNLSLQGEKVSNNDPAVELNKLVYKSHLFAEC